jgi:coenzyme F420-reducing hydrogenase gamma subunit
MVAAGTPCLGPLVHAGCGALCPSYHRGCYGCFGPKETPNPASLSRHWMEEGMDRAELVRKLRGFAAWAEPFRNESQAIEAEGGASR